MTNLSLGRTQRRRKLGIECPDRLVWKKWEPGEEHTRKLTIKNIESRAQVISFTLPENRTTFMTPFPEPITLSSGMSYELTVRFCPTEVVEIHDSIDIHVKGRGSFTVVLECLTPFARLLCTPKSYDFGFCAVRSTSTNEGSVIKIANSGTVPLEYYWEVFPPFAITPASGNLEPGQSQQLRVSFCPTEACAVLCHAVCKMVGLDEIIGTLQMSGVGKYPFVRLRPVGHDGAFGGGSAMEPPPVAADSTATAAQKKSRGKSNPKRGGKGAATAATAMYRPAFKATMDLQNAVTALIDFHEVPAGCTATHEFIVENPSSVHAQVALHCSSSHGGAGPDAPHGASNSNSSSASLEEGPTSSLNSSAFHIQPAAADIPPAGLQVYRVTFRAANTGSRNQVACELRSTAGSTIRLGLKGAVVGPRVRASTSYINYGDVDLGKVLPSDHNSPATVAREVQERLVRHFTLTNASAVQPCHYQFLATSPGAAFHVDPVMGSVAPGQSVRVRVTFQPTAPVHYLRRLFLLVQGSAEMLYVDVFGTAFIGDNRPPPLGLPAVDAFFSRLRAGLAHYTPVDLENAAALDEDNDADDDDAIPGVLATVLLTQTDGREGGQVFAGNGGRVPATRKGTGRLSFAEATEELAIPLASSSGQPSKTGGASGPFALDKRVLTFPRPSAPNSDAQSNGGGGAVVTAVQYVTVSNTSPEPAVATWAVPHRSAFAVVPSQQEVPPNGAAQFQVVFRTSPNAADGGGGGDAAAASFGQPEFLECYVNYAQMSSFRFLRSRAAVTPPHCLTLHCRPDNASNAVSSARPQLLSASAAGRKPPGSRAAAAAASAPDLHMAAGEPFVSFPACYVNGASYQVLSIINDDDVAHAFELKGLVVGEVSEKIHRDITVLEGNRLAAGRLDGEGEDGSPTSILGSPRRTLEGKDSVDVGETFTCYPHSGLIPPHQRALLLLRFFPTCHARYAAEMHLDVYTSGSSHRESIVVALCGETDIPQLELATSFKELYRSTAEGGRRGGRPSITFLPTCVTGEAKLPLWLWNPTSHAVEYQFIPSDELLGVVRFEPAGGVLQGGERQSVTACFAPETARRYEGSGYLFTRGAYPNAVTARSADVSLTENKEYVCAWHVLGEGMHGVVEVEPTEMDLGSVTGLEPQTVAITLFNSGLCEVGYEVRSFTCSEPTEWRHTSPVLKLRNHAGTIPARTHRIVLATVQPAAGLAEYLVYVMIAGLDTDISRVPSPCSVEGVEHHPHCRLSIRGTRPAVQVADVRSLTQLRSHLWRQLSIPALNKQLAAPVEPADVATDSYTFHQFIEGLTPITMELAVGPRYSAPAVFTVRLENVGDCATNFSLWMPTESSVTEENWFLEDGALKDIESILDKRIIEVSPRSGTIPAGGSTALTLVYRFLEVGIHTLPVVLRVADGRRVLVVLEGRTVPEGVSCLTMHTASAVYELLPVALGDVEPPMQSVMVLDNPLDRPVTYMVDQQMLRQLAEVNFGFPILHCVNPTGVLPPRSMTELRWYFRPLEAKEYTMPISVLTCMTPSGDGTDAAHPAVEEDDCGESYTYTFVGRGYHPLKTPEEEVRVLTEQAFLALTDTAPSQSSVSSLPVSLSPETYSVGAIPYFTLHRSCCSLVNTHPTDSYSFEFDTHHMYGDHLLTIQPSRGRLPPNGGRADCRMTFYSGSTSQLLQWSVPCHLTNETAVEEFMAADGLVPSHPTTGAVGGTSTNVVEYFAVDGIGLLQMQQESGGGNHHGGTAFNRPAFERTTCTKAALMRLRRQLAGQSRLPVTAIPPESLGLAALSRQAFNTREETGSGTAGASHYAPSEAVVSAVVELLVQARVMPAEDYERIYGRSSSETMFQPLVSVFKDPMCMTGGKHSEAATVDEASVANEVMEELVRAVVAQPSVRAAFTEPHRSEVIYYKDVKEGRGSPSPKAPQERGKSSGDDKDVLVGLVSNVLEEALDEVVFQSVMSGVHEAIK